MGARAGPESTLCSGRSHISSRRTTPPDRWVASSGSPAKPSSRRRRSTSWRCARMSGFSEASMTVAEARRYSRITGFRRWLSVTSTPGSRPASRTPMRSSWTGFTTDHSRHTPTASTASSSSRSMTASTAASSSGCTDGAVVADPLGDREGERPRDVRVGVGDRQVQRIVLAALPVHEDVPVALGGHEGRAGGAALEDGVGRRGRRVHERRRVGEELADGRSPGGGRVAERGVQAEEHVVGRRRRLVQTGDALPVGHDEVGEGPAGVDGDGGGHRRKVPGGRSPAQEDLAPAGRRRRRPQRAEWPGARRRRCRGRGTTPARSSRRGP